MKKVWVILLLVSLALLPGCQSPDRATSMDEGRPGTAASRSNDFWDKNFGSLAAVPAPSETTSQPTVPVPMAPSRGAPVARANIEPVGPSGTLQPAMLAPVRGELQPVPLGPSPSGLERPTSLAPSLVAVDGSGARTSFIIYPRVDYGIIQVDKVMPPEVRPNTPFTYLITVTNLTDTVLDEITLTETLSKELQFKGSDPSAAVEDNTLTWKIDSLGPRAYRSIKISCVATASKEVAHSTSVTYTVKNTEMLKVVEPMLEISKTAPMEALLCEPIPVEFVVTNTGTGTAQNVQIVDNLPAGLQTVDGKGKVTLDAGTLAAGESRRFSIKLRAIRTGTYVDKAVATCTAGLQAESEATTTNIRQPILAISKTGPKRQYLGRSVAYEITVSNKGDGPAQNTVVEDIVPPGVTGIEATAGAQSSGSKLTWELGTLEPNTYKKVRVSYTPTKEGEMLATATATAYCADPVSDSTRTTISGIAAPHLEVVDLEDPVEIGNTTTYVITVTNEGSAADNNVRLVCTIDEKVQYVSSAGATAGSVMGKTVNFAPLRNLEPRTKATWRVIVRGAQPGDVRFKVAMHTDQLSLPVEVTEATHVYQQFGNGQ